MSFVWHSECIYESGERTDRQTEFTISFQLWWETLKGKKKIKYISDKWIKTKFFFESDYCRKYFGNFGHIRFYPKIKFLSNISCIKNWIMWENSRLNPTPLPNRCYFYFILCFFKLLGGGGILRYFEGSFK